MTIKNHKFTEANHSHQSPNKRKGTMTPRIIVLHYTASGGKTGGGDAEYLSRASSRASAQLVIGREGDLHQLMPLNNIAWHAGKSSHNGKSDVNAFSIGIELDNWGWLDGRGINLPEDQIHKAKKYGKTQWEKYPQAQLDACEKAVAEICKKYPIEDIVGHEDVSPGRKQDPGPALDDFKAYLKKKYLKKASKTLVNLNMRTAASMTSPIQTVIPANTPITIIDKPYPGWAFVQFKNRKGYVVTHYQEKFYVSE